MPQYAWENKNVSMHERLCLKWVVTLQGKILYKSFKINKMSNFFSNRVINLWGNLLPDAAKALCYSF